MEPCILKEVLYVPSCHVTDENIEDYTYFIEKTETKTLDSLPKQCSSCDLWGKKWRPGRITCSDAGFTSNDICDKFSFRTIIEKNLVEIKTHRNLDNGYYIFARGDIRKLLKNFGHLDINDQRVRPHLDIGLKLKPEFTLRPDQVEVMNQWLVAEHGIVHAPVGFGKTVMLSWLIGHLKTKTMILSHETRHLAVVYEGLHRVTNVSELEERTGETLVGIYGKKKYIKKDGSLGWKSDPQATYPITISTFQSLNSERGKKDLNERLRDMFGMVWIEEAHHESARTFHAVTRSFNAYYRGGQTGTPVRKNNMHHATYDTIGPVTAMGTKVSLIPRVKFIETGVLAPDWIFKRQYWNSTLASFLAKNPLYTNVQFENIIADCKAGRKIVVMTERKMHAKKLRNMINMAGYNACCIMRGEKIKEQAEYNELFLSGGLHVALCTSMVFENFDVPAWDCIHLPFPNFDMNKEEQMIGRIRRPNVENKPQPLVRVYKWSANSNIAQRCVGVRVGFYNKSNFDVDTPEVPLFNNQPRMNEL